ncbi:MAG TPA: serine hydrolase [Candidatus Limnocylindria bacterium]|nr:serine hydrolase [Candidatus Limnocylindria bacterium]
MKKCLALIALLLSACGSTTTSLTSPHPSQAQPEAAAETVAVASHTAGPRPGAQAAAPALIVTPETADRIDALLTRQSGRAAVIVAGGRSGEMLYAVGADEPVFAASLYKLGVLLEAERRIDAGTLHPADLITVTAADQSESGSFTATGSVLTVDEALERTIVLSDNASALALIRRLGIANVQATLDREGIYLRFTADGAITTARGIATFFGELVRGSLVSRDASARMLARLSRQRTVDRLPAALPAGAVLAHKTGNLGFATHDAGIVTGPGGAPIVLVVLTWDSAERDAIYLIREIALLAYQGLART